MSADRPAITTEEAEWNLAQALYEEGLRLDPLPDDAPWCALSERERGYHRSLVRAVLLRTDWVTAATREVAHQL
jgi:hypothetical protein